MAGWSRQKRKAVESAFYKFLDRCFVISKDAGRICLGEHLYNGQRYCITQIFDALEQDIHKIYVLKSRQLGISTIIRALTVFLLGIHDGLKGAIVFDTETNKTEAKSEITIMIEDLPASLKFPQITSNNRTGLALKNNSKILFMSAGTKKTKSSGTLGRSVGLTIAHCSELCSYDNDEGLEAFEQSLSDAHPDRVFIYESTARGHNAWWVKWREARNDPDHCKCIFLGWWSKDSQRIAKGEKDFNRYGLNVPTDDEKKKIEEVREKYGVSITAEQLAWVRRKYDPSAIQTDGTGEVDYENNATRVQEQPWVEEDSFQQTGAVFFSAADLTMLVNKFVDRKFKKYQFSCGEEFADMKILPAQNIRSVEFKVWEEPATDAVYVIGVDPAYGENETNCNSAIQVLRCYADGLDQVAEYAWPLITTRHLAWALAAILAWYGQGRNEARYILELNGPGTATFNEIKSLKFHIENAKYLTKPLEERGLLDVFKNVKTYIYSRPDAMGAGYNWHWLTNTRLKITLMERLRDIASNGKLRTRSLDVVEEMKSISREGDSIGAPGTMRDDRAIALALAVYYWESKIRPFMIVANRTRESEEARAHLSIVDQVKLFNQNSLEQFFAVKRGERRQQQMAMQRNQWRYGGRRY